MKAACERLGWTFREGVKRFRWYGHFVDDSPVVDGIFDKVTTERVRAMSSHARKAYMNEHFPVCDHVIEVPGCDYSVGVFRKEDGSWGLKWDYYHGLNNALGQDAGIFQQAYGVEVWRETALEQGHRILGEYAQADGSIELEVEV